MSHDHELLDAPANTDAVIGLVEAVEMATNGAASSSALIGRREKIQKLGELALV